MAKKFKRWLLEVETYIDKNAFKHKHDYKLKHLLIVTNINEHASANYYNKRVIIKKEKELLKGLITSIISNTYEVEDLENGKIVKCCPRGKLKKDDISLAVGDKVDFEYQNEEQGIINGIFERTNFIKRPKMANISQMIFIVSMKMPKPDLLLSYSVT